MSSVPATGSSTGTTHPSNSSDPTNALSSLGVNDFLKMMIAQLQNQDPLSPMDSGQMLQQLSVMTQVTSDNKLNSTLTSVQLGQNLTNAAGFIGKNVAGLSDASTQISGIVDSVSIVNGTPTLHIGNNTMSLNNVGQILAAHATASTNDTTDNTAGATTDGTTTGSSGTTGS